MTGAGPIAKLRTMDPKIRSRADARLEDALEQNALHDPRDFYRERLKYLRNRDPAAFEEALRYFEDVLLPRVAAEGTDPVAEWLEYGRRLAELGGPGRAVIIDASGRAHSLTSPAPSDRLILYLPDDSAEPALVLNLPRRLSAAQRATVDLLVEGKVVWNESGQGPAN